MPAEKKLEPAAQEDGAVDDEAASGSGESSEVLGRQLFVVGIGASAGGIELKRSLQHLVQAVPGMPKATRPDLTDGR